jgi:hypothetical protein
MSDIDTGDYVHHARSGEDWVVAYVRGDRVAWCGWPPGEAALADCTLVQKASSADRAKLLLEMANSMNSDIRAAYARAKLAECHKPSETPR